MSSLLDRLHPVTAAGLCEELRVDEIWRLLDLAPLDNKRKCFRSSATKQVEMVGDVGRDRMSQLLETMPHDDRVDLLKRLDSVVVREPPATGIADGSPGYPESSPVSRTQCAP